jgi:hypothetical protein
VNRTLPAVEVVTPADSAERALPEQVQVSLAEIAGHAKEGLLALAVGTGLAVLSEAMEHEVCELVGTIGRHDAERSAYRHGRTTRAVTLGGRRVGVERPRVRANSDEPLLLRHRRVLGTARRRAPRPARRPRHLRPRTGAARRPAHRQRPAVEARALPARQPVLRRLRRTAPVHAEHRQRRHLRVLLLHQPGKPPRWQGPLPGRALLRRQDRHGSRSITRASA